MKQEQKQHIIDMMKSDEELGLYDEPKKEYKYIGECSGNNGNGCFLDSSGHDCGCFTRVLKEEPKKETALEEVAHKMLSDYGIMSMGQSIGVLEVKKLMVKMAKWQAEKMYSEEDMKSFGDWCRNGLLNTEYGVEKLDEHLEQWKQFKK